MSDPYLTLGIPRDADDETVQRAYLEGIKRAPPERDPERFEALRAAYEALRTRRDRLAHELFDDSAPTPQEMLDKAAPVGPPRRPERGLFEALLKGIA